MAGLPKRQLGRTGIEVTSLGYGAMELRGAPRGRDITPEQAGAVLNAALDSGITFVDTSPDYGQSEELIGRYISNRRSEYFLATKCGCQPFAPPGPPGQRPPHLYTKENVLSVIDNSLSRLKTDHVDLLQVHASPSRQVLEENGIIDVLFDLKRQGKVRFLGMSGTLPHLVDHIAMGVFDVFQIPYSALDREHEDMIARAGQAGAGIIIRGGAAKGAPAADKQKGEGWDVWQQAHLEDLLGDMSPMEFILRFTFTHPEMDTNIVGTISPDHLRDNVNAMTKGELPADLYAEAKRRVEAAGSSPAQE